MICHDHISFLGNTMSATNFHIVTVVEVRVRGIGMCGEVFIK